MTDSQKMQNSPNYVAWLMLALIAAALLSSCTTRKTLFSRSIYKGVKTAWQIDYEGSFEKDTTIFIDGLTGSVEFKYSRLTPKN